MPKEPAPLILVVCAGEDEANAGDSIVKLIDTEGIARYWHSDSPRAGSPAADAAWWSELKRLIAELSATKVLFLDGQCERDWIDTRLVRYPVVASELLLRPGVAVCYCPPPEKVPKRRYNPVGRMTILRHDDLAGLRTFFRS